MEQELPSGRVIRVLAHRPEMLTDGREALLLSYRTQHLGDPAALNAEIDDVWAALRPAAEREGRTCVLVRADDRVWQGWEQVGDELQFVFERDGNEWSRREDPERTVR